MLTTKDRHDFLRAGEKIEDEAGTLVYYDSVSDQKRIGPHVHEAVTFWSDEIAQTQEMESMVPRRMSANTPVNLPGTHGEILEHSQSCQSSSEIVLQLLSTSQTPDTVVIVQQGAKRRQIETDLSSPARTVWNACRPAASKAHASRLAHSCNPGT